MDRNHHGYDLLYNSNIIKKYSIEKAQFFVNIINEREIIEFRTTYFNRLVVNSEVLAIYTSKYEMKIENDYAKINTIGQSTFFNEVSFRYKDIKDFKIVKRVLEIFNSLIIELDKEDFKNQVVISFNSSYEAEELYNLLMKKCPQVTDIRKEKERKK